jgi:hypothetical protein
MKKKKLTPEEKERYNQNMQYIYESEMRDIDRFVEYAKSKDAKVYDKPAQLATESDKVPTLDALPIPVNLDDAIKVLSVEENIKFVHECKDENDFLCKLHHGFGTGLRNGWGLWTGSILAQWFNDKGIYHADDISSIILTSLYRTVKGEDIKLDEQIKHYQDHWEKYNPDVNKGII